ncbi:MAG: diguanylate cyclase [Lachnospiraceae bacterium]|nr:diguanylate cyclase [Lachnospiraceae bacterium]
MVYSGFGMLTLVLHFIINHEAMKKSVRLNGALPALRYRHYLYGITIYYISDILWGFIYEAGIIPLSYLNTVINFASMALSLLLWTRYVVAYVDRKGAKSTAFLGAGWMIFGYIILNLIVNLFYPVVFHFDENKVYIPGPARYVNLGLQFILFVAISVYSLFIAKRTDGKDRMHYQTVGVSGAVMAGFITLQFMKELLPFYAIGTLIATCLIHVFVEEDEKTDKEREFRDVKMQAVLEREKSEEANKEKEIYNNIADGLAGDYEAIYYVNIESGTYREFSASEKYRSMLVPKYGEDFYKETRENVGRYAHPDDRAFAQSLYYKEKMLMRLRSRRSYSYKYRIMVNGEVRFFRFDVMLAQDGRHFILCDKDITDEITAENSRMEDQKKQVTFGQIAESLALNYDVIYYVDAKDGNYVGYTSRNIYGQLEVNRSGDDFFADSRKNLQAIIHPQDRERVLEMVNSDHLISALEDRKEYNIEYRLIIDDRSQHTRMSVRKSSDSKHLIIGVENIDDEVRKEKEHLKALNTEKELARRDELTGTKNKTAYSELEQAVQNNIDNGLDYLPFAIAVCDINDLKKVNDTEGHKAGDEYIKAASQILCSVFAHSPVFRIGGDEFVVFLRGNDYSKRKKLMNRLHETIFDNMKGNRGPVIAAGMSEFRQGEDRTVGAVFERADNMMYADKRELKGQKIK